MSIPDVRLKKGDETRQDLIVCKGKFAETILQIEQMNNHNQDLIAASLSHTNNTFIYINNLS